MVRGAVVVAIFRRDPALESSGCVLFEVWWCCQDERRGVVVLLEVTEWSMVAVGEPQASSGGGERGGRESYVCCFLLLDASNLNIQIVNIIFFGKKQ